MVTVFAKRVKKRASSTAESPPPTTNKSWSRKKAPSHTAQYETPRLFSSSSPGTPKGRCLEPVATITVRVSYV